MRTSTNAVMLGIGVFVAVGGVAAVNLILPNFEEVFRNFGAELPWFTRMFVEGRHLLWLLPLLVPAIALFVPERRADDRRRGATGLVLGIAIGVLLPMLGLMACYLPIFQLGAVVG